MSKDVVFGVISFVVIEVLLLMPAFEEDIKDWWKNRKKVRNERD